MLGLCIYLLLPAQALAQALLRFVHAVPGVGRARLQLTAGSQTIDFGTIGFAQSTAWHSVRSGQFTWRIEGTNGKTLTTGTATAGNGAYNAVVLAHNAGVMIGMFRDRAGVPGQSLIRVIHAAPELGSPELKFDSKVVLNRLDFTQATPYLTVSPGVHSLAAMAPGRATPVISASGVRLAPGVAYSVIVVGSQGQRVRAVTVIDRGAPLTRPAPVPATKRSGQTTSAAVRSRWLTVRPGDSLWNIARDRLGAGASNTAVWHEVVAIWDANVLRIGTGDPNLIFPGQRLRLPRS